LIRNTRSSEDLSNLFGEEFFHLVMDNNPDRVFVKNEQGIIVYANRAFLEMYAPEERPNVIGSTSIENFSAEQIKIFQAEDNKAFAEGTTQLVEELTDYTGRLFIFLSTKTSFRAKDGRLLMLGVCDDITELAKRERELVEANNALQNFAALAAHDLRSPLGTYASLIELIKLDKENTLSTQTREYLEMMGHSTRQLSAHISGLLGTYKAGQNQKIDEKPVDLNILLGEVKFNLSAMITAAGAKIRSNRLPVLNVDENLFRHMLHNLIENAIKYRSASSPIIILKHEHRDDCEYFTIEDNGIGISPEQEEKVFRLFEQSGNRKLSGAGLGLSLCLKIAELHQGKMWIDHEYKNGCRICFTICSNVLNQVVK
jgi:PAS domain S-box-containing protein